MGRRHARRARHTAFLMKTAKPKCDQCGRAAGTVNRRSVCDPGGEPIGFWLHRECKSAFLEQLDDSLIRTGPELEEWLAARLKNRARRLRA